MAARTNAGDRPRDLQATLEHDAATNNALVDAHRVSKAASDGLP